MRPDWLPLLRCPVTGTPYDLDSTRVTSDDVVEGFLVARGGREVRLLVQGLPVLPVDLQAHLQSHGHVYSRIPLADSRVVRFVHRGLGRGEDDRVPFDEVVGRYGDLVPPGTWPEPPSMAPEDAALAALLSQADVGGVRGLDIGCGIGRGVFVLREHLEQVIGVDRSIARLRRARNVAVTQSDFFLPAPVDSGRKEIGIELDRLSRDACDFAVADADVLPFVDGAFDVVVLRAGDGRGPFEDRAGVLAQAVRVLDEGGVLVTLDGGPEPAGDGWSRGARHADWTAWRRA